MFYVGNNTNLPTTFHQYLSILFYFIFFFFLMLQNQPHLKPKEQLISTKVERSDEDDDIEKEIDTKVLNFTINVKSQISISNKKENLHTTK